MKVVKVSFHLNDNGEFDKISDEVQLLLGAWRMNGQVMTNEFPIAQNGKTLEVFLDIPESHSLEDQNNSKFVAEKGLN